MKKLFDSKGKELKVGMDFMYGDVKFSVVADNENPSGEYRLEARQYGHSNSDSIERYFMQEYINIIA